MTKKMVVSRIVENNIALRLQQPLYSSTVRNRVLNYEEFSVIISPDGVLNRDIVNDLQSRACGYKQISFHERAILNALTEWFRIGSQRESYLRYREKLKVLSSEEELELIQLRGGELHEVDISEVVLKYYEKENRYKEELLFA